MVSHQFTSGFATNGVFHKYEETQFSEHLGLGTVDKGLFTHTHTNTDTHTHTQQGV